MVAQSVLHCTSQRKSKRPLAPYRRNGRLAFIDEFVTLQWKRLLTGLIAEPLKNGIMSPVPQRWSNDELQVDRDLAEKRFIAERQGEGPAAFYGVWDKVEPQVRAALEATKNLREIDSAAFIASKQLWQILRYVCAPRVSEEDLWTLVGKKFKTVPAAFADNTAKTISALIDAKRFPWVAANREPTALELEASVLATTTLLAHEALNTSRRGSASKSQEEQVSEVLTAAGLELDVSRKPMPALDELARGRFSRERKVGGAKCDVPIRLNDGRLLALECKVSNGPKNSWKRLQREIGGKADTWKQSYGTQVITGAVLAGVFDLKCLVDAQNRQNVVLFWQHDLKPLVEFVQAR